MPEQTVMVWIEDGTGTIARGQADAVSTEGACVRLAGAPSFGEGDDVAVRISFERGAPTVATTARVSGIRANGNGVLCDLRWSTPAEHLFAAHAA